MLNSAMVVMASQTVIQCVLFKNCSKLEKKPSHYSKDFKFIISQQMIILFTFWTISLTARSLPASCPTNSNSCSTVWVAEFLK